MFSRIAPRTGPGGNQAHHGAFSGHRTSAGDRPLKVENLDDLFWQEEHQADAKLTKIAESKLNKEAA